MAASEKKNKELADRNAELRAKYADLLKKEEAPANSVSAGAVAPIAPPNPTDIYSLQKNKIKSKMLRRRKPQ